MCRMKPLQWGEKSCFRHTVEAYSGRRLSSLIIIIIHVICVFWSINVILLWIVLKKTVCLEDNHHLVFEYKLSEFVVSSRGQMGPNSLGSLKVVLSVWPPCLVSKNMNASTYKSNMTTAAYEWKDLLCVFFRRQLIKTNSSRVSNFSASHQCMSIPCVQICDHSVQIHYMASDTIMWLQYVYGVLWLWNLIVVWIISTVTDF